MSKFIICPLSYRKIILTKLRKEDPFLDIHFFSKEDLFRSKYGLISDEGLIYLIEKYHLQYFVAQEIAKILPYIDVNQTYHNERLNRYQQYLKELIAENYFSYDETTLMLLSKQNVEIHYYYYDRKLNEILDEISAKYIYIEHEIFKPHYFKFNNLNDEILFVFSKIGELISQGVSPRKIHLLGVDDTYLLSINSLARNYHINLNYQRELSLGDYQVSKKIIDYFYEEKNDPPLDDYLKFLLVEYPQDEEIIHALKLLLKRFNFKTLPPQEIAKIYQEIFNLSKLNPPFFTEGIFVNDNNLLNEDDYLFILNFSSKNYPPKIKDNSLLVDEEKAILNLLSTQEENLIKKEEFKVKITQNDHIYLTFCRFLDGKEQYESSSINELNIVNETETKLNIYSTLESKNQLSIAKDNLYTYLKKTPYYDSLFKQIGHQSNYNTYDLHFKINNKIKEYHRVELSYSSASNYVRCPFRYYLANVLKIDAYEESFNQKIGTFVHAIFEKICEPFTFDGLFQKGENANIYSDLEKCFIPRLNSDLKATYDKFKIYFERFSQDDFKHEYVFSFPLDELVVLNGKIDLIFEQNNYLLFVDYKTSTASYSVNSDRLKYGDCLQLPTYSLLTQFDKRFLDKQIGGLAYLNLLNDKCNLASYDLDSYLKSLIFRGLFLSDKNFLASLDDNQKIINHQSNYFPKSYLNKRDKAFKDADYFAEIQEITSDIYRSIGHRIYNNDFSISSLRFDGEDYGCSYCNFSDICFKDLSVYEDINLKFEDEDEDDD